jgi:hypothetical protein
MYIAIMQLNEERTSDEQCVEPLVFKNDGGYQVFADYAASIGLGASWQPWSEDEPCAPRAVASDTEVAHEWADFCSVREDVLENGD